MLAQLLQTTNLFQLNSTDQNIVKKLHFLIQNT